MRLKIFEKDGRGKTYTSSLNGRWSEREFETPYTQVRNQNITDEVDIKIFTRSFNMIYDQV